MTITPIITSTPNTKFLKESDRTLPNPVNTATRPTSKPKSK